MRACGPVQEVQLTSYYSVVFFDLPAIAGCRLAPNHDMGALWITGNEGVRPKVCGLCRYSVRSRFD
jgi:hypothetical protein